MLVLTGSMNNHFTGDAGVLRACLVIMGSKRNLMKMRTNFTNFLLIAGLWTDKTNKAGNND